MLRQQLVVPEEITTIVPTLSGIEPRDSCAQSHCATAPNKIKNEINKIKYNLTMNMIYQFNICSIMMSGLHGYGKRVTVIECKSGLYNIQNSINIYIYIYIYIKS